MRATLTLAPSHILVYCVSFVLQCDMMRTEELLELLSRQCKCVLNIYKLNFDDRPCRQKVYQYLVSHLLCFPPPTIQYSCVRWPFSFDPCEILSVKCDCNSEATCFVARESGVIETEQFNVIALSPTVELSNNLVTRPIELLFFFHI